MAVGSSADVVVCCGAFAPRHVEVAMFSTCEAILLFCPTPMLCNTTFSLPITCTHGVVPPSTHLGEYQGACKHPHFLLGILELWLCRRWHSWKQCRTLRPQTVICCSMDIAYREASHITLGRLCEGCMHKCICVPHHLQQAHTSSAKLTQK